MQVLELGQEAVARFWGKKDPPLVCVRYLSGVYNLSFEPRL